MAVRFIATKDQKEILLASLESPPTNSSNTVDILRRIQKLRDAINEPPDQIHLDHDDFAFLRERFKMADAWQPTEKVIKAVTAVEDILDETHKKGK